MKTSNELLDMLEELLSITQEYKDKMDSYSWDVWQRISAETADDREERDLNKVQHIDI